MIWSLLLACTEPLDLPADPAARGVPVGVQTIHDGGQTYEVYYPAPDAASDDARDRLDFDAELTPALRAALGDVPLPSGRVDAARDAPLRRSGEDLPVLLFSHGFASFRAQSHSLLTHLASRGYVVVAADHPGRMLTDLLPCVFEPAVDGCDLSQLGDDPAPEDLKDAADWLETSAFAGFVAPPPWGALGHSAGGNTLAHLTDPRVGPRLSMAGAPVLSSEPAAWLSGTCDGVLPDADTTAAFEASSGGVHVQIEGAGHMAFADICQLGLVDWAEANLAGRDDVSAFFYDSLIALAADGCPGFAPTIDGCTAFLDLDVSDPVLRHTVTAFFDDALRGEGRGIPVDAFPEARVTVR